MRIITIISFSILVSFNVCAEGFLDSVKKATHRVRKVNNVWSGANHQAWETERNTKNTGKYIPKSKSEQNSKISKKEKELAQREKKIKEREKKIKLKEREAKIRERERELGL